MLGNFRVIMRYNPAEAYALAIGHLSDRLRGGEPLVQSWPRHERVLSREERTEMQQLLIQRGFDIGEPDGRLRRENPRCDPGFPGAGRAGSGWVPHRHRARAVARQLRKGRSDLRLATFFCYAKRSGGTAPPVNGEQVQMAQQSRARKRTMVRAACLGGLALAAAASLWPAQAQFFPFDDRFFGIPRPQKPRAPVQQEQTNARLRRRRKSPPTIRILVLGDSLADWLAYGLEEQLAETPEIGIVRKGRAYSGLIRYDQKSDADWPKVARELIAAGEAAGHRHAGRPA